MFSQPVAATSTSTSLQCSANCCLMKITKYIGVGTGGQRGQLPPQPQSWAGGRGYLFAPQLFATELKSNFEVM